MHCVCVRACVCACSVLLNVMYDSTLLIASSIRDEYSKVFERLLKDKQEKLANHLVRVFCIKSTLDCIQVCMCISAYML